MKRQSTKRSATTENGIYMVLMAVFLTALFLLVGLGIDSANLYRGYLRLQRAVDAGAVGATYLFGSQPNTVIEDVATKVARDNLLRMDMGIHSLTVTSTASQVTIQGTADVPLMIMQMIPGMGNFKTVSATARAETVRTIVSLVLDRTGSMSCPADGSDCTGCYTAPIPPNCLPSKLDKLKDAAIAFTNLFENNADQFALVSFSQSATADIPMGPLDKAAVTSAILAMNPAGQTYIQSGIAEGQNQLANANNYSGARKVMVVVTDGAPSFSDNNYPISMGCPPGANPTLTQQRYIKTIAQADLARATTNTTIYTIGLGNAAQEGSDPYQQQQSNDSEYLKSYLLKRVANSSEASTNPSFDCVPSYNQYNASPGLPKGTYLQTPNANQLQNLLVSVGRSIRARMIQ